MNRREFLTNAFKISVLGAVQFSLLGNLLGTEKSQTASGERISRRNFHGLSLPLLGLGLMHLPRIGKNTNEIDSETSERMIHFAMERGINYFDTASNYHGGKNERFISRALKKYSRNSYFLASKLSLNKIYSIQDARNEVERQLRQCGTSYFDFYMLQSLDSAGIARAVKYGLPKLLQELKQCGKIRFIGFSFIDTPEVLEQVIPLTKWDFAQIELNYADWELCRSKDVYDRLAKHNIPVIAANVLRDGELEKLNPAAAEKLKYQIAKGGIPSWAHRFATSLPGVTFTVCHATSQKQLAAAVQSFLPFEKLSAQEQKELSEAQILYMKTGGLNPCGNCSCTKSDPTVDSRSVASCPFSIHQKNRRFKFL